MTNKPSSKRPLIFAIGITILILTTIIALLIYLFSVKTCTGNCSSKVCGSDGCGGSCGTCSTGSVCDYYYQCCSPTCSPNQQCGNDMCGGTCGECDKCDDTFGNCKCNTDYMGTNTNIPANTILRCPQKYPKCINWNENNPNELGVCTTK